MDDRRALADHPTQRRKRNLRCPHEGSAHHPGQVEGFVLGGPCDEGDDKSQRNDADDDPHRAYAARYMVRADKHSHKRHENDGGLRRHDDIRYLYSLGASQIHTKSCRDAGFRVQAEQEIDNQANDQEE